MADTIDYQDPCAVAQALREVIAKRVLAGGGDVLETRAGDEMVKYGSMPLADLRAELSRYERECAIKQGSAAPVSAMRLGAFGIFRKC